VRRAHVKLSGSVFCQHCGVDLLALVAQLKGLPSEEARRALLLARLPHLARWPGKLDRAATEPSEGRLWEADHRREVRDGGGEAASEGAFDPLCVGCHQRKTNATTRGRGDDEAVRLRGFSFRGAAEGSEAGNRKGAASGAPRKRRASVSPSGAAAGPAAASATAGEAGAVRGEPSAAGQPSAAGRPSAGSDSEATIADDSDATIADESDTTVAGSTSIGERGAAQADSDSEMSLLEEACSRAAPPPMPVPAPAVALEAPAVCWEVELSGRFQAYGSEQQFALETAHQRGDDVASISVRGTVYEVRLRGEQRQRGLGADAWRSRRVRRRVS